MEKKFYTTWQFWAVIGVFFLICIITDIKKPEETVETYVLTGEQLGKYGREVVLNKDTDMPVTKYLYKIPAGKYKVTTDNEKVSSFYVVKDEIGHEDTEYPEVLQYVTEGFLITISDNTFNGHVQKTVEITLNDDESIQIVGTDTIKLEKI